MSQPNAWFDRLSARNVVGAPRPRASLRHHVAELLDRSGIVDGVAIAREALGVPAFPVLTYHRIGPVPEDDPFDVGVVDATKQSFEAHVTMIVRSFVPVGLDDVLAHFAGVRELPPKAAMITFDDGYRSCSDIALPILRRHGAKATFFVSTGHIGARRLFWWDRVSYVVGHSAERDIVLAYPSPLRIRRARGDHDAVTSRLLRIVKDTFALDVERFLRELAEAARVDWSDELDRRLADDLLLRWADVRDLREAGMDIASHTRWHRVLDTLEDATLDEELAGSRADLEAELRRPVLALSYPVGVAGDHRVAAAVRRAGYQIAFSHATGVNDLRSIESPLAIRRIAVEQLLSDHMLRASMTVPNLTPTAHPRKAR